MKNDQISSSKIPSLSLRLRAIANEVRQGSCLYDVGTDHAYLPIALVAEGKVRSAVASDIGEGPLARARKAVERAGLSSSIQTVLTPGLSGLKPVGLSDIVIAGMGGEMIASILAERKGQFDKEVRLILQPMSKHEYLRLFLAENGFSVLSERYIEDGCKIYPILLCAYTGDIDSLTPTELSIGKASLRLINPAYLRFLREKADTLSGIIRGKHSAGIPSEEEETVCREILGIIAANQADRE